VFIDASPNKIQQNHASEVFMNGYSAFLLALVVSVSFSGCSNGGSSSPVASGGSTAGQGQAVSETATVSTVAGSAGIQNSLDGTGPAANFNFPMGITTDGINLYVSDTINNTIRKIVISSGFVTTLAGMAGPDGGSNDGVGAFAGFWYPTGITTDGTNLYVADAGNMTIRKIVISSGEVTTLAGTVGVSGTEDGIGAAAKFVYPMGITTDGANLYVTDNIENTVRKIVISTGQVTTLAGTAGLSGPEDGNGPAAHFWYPADITTDGINLYVADAGNMTIRKIVIATRQVTTVAGTAGMPGSNDGPGLAASFSCPDGITTDGANLYVADSGNMTVRKIIISTGAVTTLAGTIGVPGSAEGIGSTASFSAPWGITTDGANLYVADTYSHTIRKVVEQNSSL
jgi:hypothetical protein